MEEMPDEQARRYLASVERVLKEIKLVMSVSSIDEASVGHVVESARSYSKDAEYYLPDRPLTALAAACYAEGLLDALKFLGLARFSWPPSGDVR